MDRIKSVVHKIFSGVETSYLIKSYFFALVLVFIIISGAVDSGSSAFTYFYVITCGFLFPFATVLWDDFINTIIEGNIILLPLPIMVLWKLFKIIVLFLLTPFIAPIGFIYIYIANGYHKSH